MLEVADLVDPRGISAAANYSRLYLIFARRRTQVSSCKQSHGVQKLQAGTGKHSVAAAALLQQRCEVRISQAVFSASSIAGDDHGDPFQTDSAQPTKFRAGSEHRRG